MISRLRILDGVRKTKRNQNSGFLLRETVWFCQGEFMSEQCTFRGKIGQQESLESRIYNSMPRRSSSEQNPTCRVSHFNCITNED